MSQTMQVINNLTTQVKQLTQLVETLQYRVQTLEGVNGMVHASSADVPVPPKVVTESDILYRHPNLDIKVTKTESGKGLWIYGEDTKSHKDKIKSVGSRWNSTRKMWVVGGKHLAIITECLDNLT